MGRGNLQIRRGKLAMGAVMCAQTKDLPTQVRGMAPQIGQRRRCRPPAKKSTSPSYSATLAERGISLFAKRASDEPRHVPRTESQNTNEGRNGRGSNGFS